MRLCAFLLLSSITVLHGLAQCDLSISGRVIDEHDRSPLAFAEVFIPAIGKGAVADVDGRFRIEGLCPGTYQVHVTHLGCEPLDRAVALEKSVELELFLEHHAQELKAAEVIARRPDENVGQPKEELGSGDMERHTGGTLAEMLSTIPGVNTLSSGPTIGKPVIHGLYGNRILTLNQGIRQEDQQWGTEHAPNLDPFSSDKITVVKGAASVQYGADALGGVIITEPVELPRDAGLHGDLRAVGMLNGRGGGGNAMLEGGIAGLRGLGWRVQGSGRALGDSDAPDYVLSNTGVREAGASAAMGWRDLRRGVSIYYSYFTRELGILRASHIGNLTDLENAISSGEPAYQEPFTYSIAEPRQVVEHHLLRAEAHQRLDERTQLSGTYGFQSDDRQEYDIRRGGRSDIPAIDLSLVTHTGDLVLKHYIGPRIHGKLGANGVWQDNYNVPGTGIRPLIPNYTKRTGGVFALEHLPLSEQVELEAGARYEGTELDVEKYDENDVLIRPRHHFTNYAASAGANWMLRDSLRLRMNVATAFRPPNVSELYSEGLHHGSAAIERGDTALTDERSLKATLDLESDWFDGRLTVDVTLYADHIDDYIYLLPDGYELTIRGAFPVFQYTATDALLLGTDANLQYRLGKHWALRSRWSVVRGTDERVGGPLFLMPSDRTENSILYVRPVAGEWRSLEVSLTSTYVFEQTRVPEGVDFSEPPPAYHLLGLSADVSRPMGAGELRIGLHGINLLNTAYRDYLDRFRYYADARGLDLQLWLRYTFGKANDRTTNERP